MKVFWIAELQGGSEVYVRFFRTDKERDVYVDNVERNTDNYIANDGHFDITGVTNIKFTEVADAD